MLKERDETDALYIVSHGQLEFFTSFEGTEFILEKLPSGSVLNHRMVFTDDQMELNIRASKHTHLLELHLDDLYYI